MFRKESSRLPDVVWGTIDIEIGLSLGSYHLVRVMAIINVLRPFFTTKKWMIFIDG